MRHRERTDPPHPVFSPPPQTRGTSGFAQSARAQEQRVVLQPKHKGCWGRNSRETCPLPCLLTHKQAALLAYPSPYLGHWLSFPIPCPVGTCLQVKTVGWCFLVRPGGDPLRPQVKKVLLSVSALRAHGQYTPKKKKDLIQLQTKTAVERWCICVSTRQEVMCSQTDLAFSRMDINNNNFLSYEWACTTHML